VFHTHLSKAVEQGLGEGCATLKKKNGKIKGEGNIGIALKGEKGCFHGFWK